ncbi:MAG: hypothetical protein KBT59_10590, partial [Sphingomonadales bacterium]|nr:hypothetical protein [Sphingomonadales bacterium]
RAATFKPARTCHNVSSGPRSRLMVWRRPSVRSIGTIVRLLAPNGGVGARGVYCGWTTGAGGGGGGGGGV